MSARTLVTRAQLLERYPLKPATLNSLIYRRAIPHIRIAPRTVVFDLDMISRWFDECRVEPVRSGNGDDLGAARAEIRCRHTARHAGGEGVR